MGENGWGTGSGNTGKVIDFGWEMPSGERRMPVGAENYEPHVRRVLDRIQGHFHSAWIPDHFMNQASHDYPEALVSLSYWAGLYPRLHFGPVVLGQNYRNPALLAKMAATLQHLSGGRFILGLGAGWKREEYLAYGYDFPPAAARIAQLAEAVQICKALWNPAQPRTTFRGTYYRVEEAICQPKPDSAPPVMIGGAGEQLMLRVVAQHADWWNLVGVSPEIYAHKIRVLEGYCRELGRDPAQIRKTWTGVVSLAASRAQAEAAMRHYPIWPGDVPLLGTPTEVVAQLRAYMALGVDLFILGFVDEPGLGGIELFIQEVIPAVRER